MAIIKYPNQAGLPLVGDPQNPSYEIIQMGTLPSGWIVAAVRYPAAGEFIALYPGAALSSPAEAGGCTKRFIPDDLFNELIQS